MHAPVIASTSSGFSDSLKSGAIPHRGDLGHFALEASESSTWFRMVGIDWMQLV